MTHTPGPWWIAAQSDLELSYLVGAGDNEHGLIYGKPNALLVKTAPDLLAFAHEVRDWARNCVKTTGVTPWHLDAADALIRKAKGE